MNNNSPSTHPKTDESPRCAVVLGSHPMYHVPDTTAAAIFVLSTGARLTVARNPKGVFIEGELGEVKAHIALSEEASEVLLSALLHSRPDKTKPIPTALLLPFANVQRSETPARGRSL